jgi:hypothetical protein
MQAKIAIYYDAYATVTTSVYEHVSALGGLPDVDIFFLAKHKFKKSDLNFFDAVVVHFSCRIAFPQTLPKNFISSLESFNGPKFIFIQDEYDNTEISRKVLEKIRPDIVFTCIPEEYHESIYPKSRFPKTNFVKVLTGFSPSPELFNQYGTPYSAREIDIGYRGRTLPFKYGKLGFDKRKIGEDVIKSGIFSNLRLDISSDEGHRIYGEHWYLFLSNCKAALGTESGSNLFDFDSKLDSLSKNFTNFKDFDEYIENECPEFTFMGQISPRIFESAAFKVLNVLYPGTYSGILQPWVHYVPLERDLSNAEEVLSIILNSKSAESITERAFIDLIKSGKYSSEAFISDISKKINQVLKESTYRKYFLNSKFSKEVLTLSEIRYLEVMQSKLMRSRLLKKFWRSAPYGLRIRIYWKINKIYNEFLK